MSAGEYDISKEIHVEGKRRRRNLRKESNTHLSSETFFPPPYSPLRLVNRRKKRLDLSDG
jgi:hypothetical protein